MRFRKRERGSVIKVFNKSGIGKGVILYKDTNGER
jgi:hypothetical protein